MKVTTRLFGEIDINDDKIIDFPQGIIGYADMNKYTLIHDEESSTETIIWLQSLDEPEFALPVINPLLVKEDYNPRVEDELFKVIGETDENVVVLVTVRVPSNVADMSVNLRAPIVINPNTLKGCQIIAEDSDLAVRFPVYDILKAKKEQGGE